MNAAPKTEDGVLIGLLPIFLPALIGMREWKHGGNRVEQVTETTDFFVATAKQESADGMTLADSYAKLSPVMGVGGSNPSGRGMSSGKTFSRQSNIAAKRTSNLGDNFTGTRD